MDKKMEVKATYNRCEKLIELFKTLPEEKRQKVIRFARLLETSQNAEARGARPHQAYPK